MRTWIVGATGQLEGEDAVGSGTRGRWAGMEVSVTKADSIENDSFMIPRFRDGNFPAHGPCFPWSSLVLVLLVPPSSCPPNFPFLASSLSSACSSFSGSGVQYSVSLGLCRRPALQLLPVKLSVHIPV